LLAGVMPSLLHPSLLRCRTRGSSELITCTTRVSFPPCTPSTVGILFCSPDLYTRESYLFVPRRCLAACRFVVSLSRCPTQGLAHSRTKFRRSVCEFQEVINIGHTEEARKVSRGEETHSELKNGQKVVAARSNGHVVCSTSNKCVEREWRGMNDGLN